MEPQSKCEACCGTRRLVLLKSWLPSDGFRPETCPICAGAGSSNHKCDPMFASEQKRLRKLAGATMSS